MTIRTKCTLACDVGLKCNKEIVKTLEGPAARQVLIDWAVREGWGNWGQRDACPECWKELHSATKGPGDEVVDVESLMQAVQT